MLLRAILLFVGLTDYIALSQNVSTRNDFDWKLFKILVSEKEGNVVLSTFSVRAVLSVLHGGAVGNTAIQLEKALDLRSGYDIATNRAAFAGQFRALTNEGKGYELHVATKIYTAPDIKHKDSFKRLIDIIRATIEKVDFQNPSEAAAKINQWVSKVTNGRIVDLVSEESAREDTRMLLLNAIYFKGRWMNPFPPKDTLPGTFYVNDQNRVTADFMKIVTTLKHVISDELDAYVVRLPYAGDRFAMNVIVPKEKNGLKGLIRKMSPQVMRGLEDQMQEGTVNLKLPKFHFDFTSALVPALQQLGIVDIFSSKANLSEIAENYQDLYVSNMIQKAGVDVNEVGTTAYGATEVELVSKFGEDIVEILADHPFVFYIEDIQTYTIVFVGSVTDPTTSTSQKPSGSSWQKPTGSTGQQPSAQVTQRPAIINGSIASKPGTNGMEDIKDRFGEEQEESDRFTAFDIEVLKHIIKNSDGKNVVWSPASMKFNLGILYEASKGKTATELSNLLGLNNNRFEGLQFLRDFYKNLKSQNEGVKLKIATRILTNNRLNVKQSFEKSVVNYFQAQVSKDDFSNSQLLARGINKWVNSSTEGLIPKLVEPDSIDPRTQVAILNAIFFKGEWQKKFDASVTGDSCFYVNENECKNTKTMINLGRYKYAEFNSLNVKALALPYHDGDNMMLILLPNKGHSLQDVGRNLTYLTLSTILNALKEQNVRLTLPKFSIDYDFKIKPFLEKEGVKEIFSDNADLTYMLDEKNKGKLSEIIHKAKIIVNEKGTTAAAATGSFVVPLTISVKLDFEVNRPFIFFIVNKKSVIIFEGIFVNPDGGTIRNYPKPQQAHTDYKTSKVEYNTPIKPPGGSVYSGIYPPQPPTQQQTEIPLKFI